MLKCASYSIKKGLSTNKDDGLKMQMMEKAHFLGVNQTRFFQMMEVNFLFYLHPPPTQRAYSKVAYQDVQDSKFFKVICPVFLSSFEKITQ